MSVKRLLRSRKDVKLAGLCGGIAEYFNIDSTIIRLGLVFLAIVYPATILVYFIAWFLIPDGTEKEED